MVQPHHAHNLGKWFDDYDEMGCKYILSITAPEWASLTKKTPHIVQKIRNLTEKTNYILGSRKFLDPHYFLCFVVKKKADG